MKIKTVIIICCLVVLNSCIVKSLQPFYTTESLSFENAFIGEWNDTKKGNWNVLSFKQSFLEENGDFAKLSNEDKEDYKKYKEGYFISYTKKERESIFIGMPFSIEGQLFIDFTPFDFNTESMNDIVSQHLLKTHSVAKLDIIENNKVQITWLDESRLSDLIKLNQLKIKYETIGVDKSLILTATSEELYKFLKKYIASDIENKWESSEKFTLHKVNVQP